MNRIQKLFKKLNLDYDDYEVVKQLAEDFKEWCMWNKAIEDIEVIQSQKFDTIVVIHELFTNYTKVADGWEFISDVKYFLKEYASNSKEDLNYMLEFWEEKIKRYE